jgi:FlaA1/EpsC-like NDP-sugar epimerase
MREPVDSVPSTMLDNKPILITAGTESFGRAFVATVLARHPNIRRLVVRSFIGAPA